MPLETMASAMDLIMSSSTLQPNLFQLFQPMGGVRATPLSRAWEVCAEIAMKAITQEQRKISLRKSDLFTTASETFRANHTRFDRKRNHRLCRKPLARVWKTE